MNSSGHSKPTYLQSIFACASVCLRKSVATSSDAGLREAQVFQQVLQRQTRIEDVFGHDDVAALDFGAEVLQDAHDAGTLGAVAVRRDGHVVHFQRQLDLAGEVGHEDGRSAQYRHQHDAAVACGVRIVACDGTAHFADAVRDFLLGEQHFRYIVMHGCPLRCFCRQHARIGAWARNTERVPHAYLAWGLVYHCAPVKKRRYGNASPSATIFTFCTGTGTLASCSRSGSGVRQGALARRQAADEAQSAATNASGRPCTRAGKPRGRACRPRRRAGGRAKGDGRRGGHARRGRRWIKGRGRKRARRQGAGAWEARDEAEGGGEGRRKRRGVRRGKSEAAACVSRNMT